MIPHGRSQLQDVPALRACFTASRRATPGPPSVLRGGQDLCGWLSYAMMPCGSKSRCRPERNGRDNRARSRRHAAQDRYRIEGAAPWTLSLWW
jgi:hypothetical protein